MLAIAEDADAIGSIVTMFIIVIAIIKIIIATSTSADNFKGFETAAVHC